MLDTGSQHTYVTEAVQNQLSLRAGGERIMSIVTFGSSEVRRCTCKNMTIALRCKDDSIVQLTVFAVPMICQPIASSSVFNHLDRFPHLDGLELAEDASANSPLDVGLLIGSDYYWEFLTGRIRRGEEGPVAIETKVGWVLSGPLPNHRKKFSSSGLMTYTLQVDTYPPKGQTLDNKLQSFWELESFGIPPSDRTMYDEFCEKVSF